MGGQYRINAPGVVSEVIDGEAVIMNLKSGQYFSAQGAGALVWEWLAQGVPATAIASSLAQRYGQPVEEVQGAVAAFEASALSHELLRASLEPPTEVAWPEAVPASWIPPALAAYSDMQDLLLLDPIHDVGDAGWPVAKGVEGT
jgi:hypothetical protein